MKSFRQYVRLFAASQLLPALESGEETLVGGQAVLEGVMMRSPHAWGIAVRKPNGEISSCAEPLDRPSEKHPWMGWPVLRGIMTLGQATVLGFRALGYATEVALEQVADGEAPAKMSGWIMGVNAVISLAFFIFMYKFVPLVAATQLKKVYPAFGNYVLFNLVDGVIRIVLFIGFLWVISRWKDIRRMFEYHGAEHKTVFAFESGNPVTVDAAQSYVTWHPRCGTSFLITVMLISIAFYTVIPASTFWARFAIRLGMLPVIIGVSYEIIRYAAKHRGSLFALLTAPGLWLQRITTQPPANDQVECAILALDKAMDLEKQRGGELVLA